MSVIAAMWSQSKPCRKPRAAVPRRSTTMLRSTAGRLSQVLAIVTLARRLRLPQCRRCGETSDERFTREERVHQPERVSRRSREIERCGETSDERFTREGRVHQPERVSRRSREIERCGETSDERFTREERVHQPERVSRRSREIEQVTK